MKRPFYFCRHCWRDERRAGASLRVAWNVARDGPHDPQPRKPLAQAVVEAKCLTRFFTGKRLSFSDGLA
jgi:hypothetical protein